MNRGGVRRKDCDGEVFLGDYSLEEDISESRGSWEENLHE